MRATCTLKSLEQIKVMANPLRMRLMEAFATKPMTTKQAAQILGQQPTKFYHHVDALERVGLIKLVKTKRKRGTIEKYYQTIADHFTVDRRLLELTPQAKTAINGLQTMVSAIFEDTVTELNQSITDKLIKPENKYRPAILTRSRISATADQIEKLSKKIHRLLKECASAKGKHGDVEYGLTLAFYPIKHKKV